MNRSLPVKESDIQASIVEFCVVRKVFCFAVVNELAGGGRSAAVRMARAKRMGLVAGVSDLIIVLPERLIFMEVKTPKGRLSASQKAFRDAMEALGFEYTVARSVDDAEASIFRGQNIRF